MSDEIKEFEAIASKRVGRARTYLTYTPEYKELVRAAFDAATGTSSERSEALRLHNAQLDEIIKLLRPMESTYRKFIAEPQSLPENTLPTYFLRRREGGIVQYQNTQDGVMNHQRVVPGQRFSVPPLHYVETATWPQFEIWEDLNARDESLAQLALAMDVSIDLDGWSLIDSSIKAAANDTDLTVGGTMTLAKLDTLMNHFRDEGFGDRISEIQIFMNSTAWTDLKANARLTANGTRLSEELEGMNIHILPNVASSFGDYGFFISTAASGAGAGNTASRVYAVLPQNYSREYIVESAGQELLIEDYTPNAAGFEKGVKGITRISRVILDDRKAASVRYK